MCQSVRVEYFIQHVHFDPVKIPETAAPAVPRLFMRPAHREIPTHL